MSKNLTNNPNFKGEEWMTTADAMAYLKVSRRTLQRWCAGKEIPYAYVGGTKYFPKFFIERLLYLKMNLPMEQESDSFTEEDKAAE